MGPLDRFHAAVFVFSFLLFSIGYDNETLTHTLPKDWIFNSLLSQCVFSVTFFNGRVLARYLSRKDEIAKGNGAIVSIAMVAAEKMQSGHSKASALVRYANSIVFLQWALIEGAMNEAKWEALVQRGLLDKTEIDMLKAADGDFASIVMTWALRIAKQLDVENLYEQFSTVLGLLGDNQLLFTKFQIPRPFFHSMWLGIQVFIINISWRASWDWAFALRGDCSPDFVPSSNVFSNNPCIGNGFIQLIAAGWLAIIMFSLFETGVQLCEPFSNGPCDYDLANDLDNNWRSSLRIMYSLETQGFPPAAQSSDGSSPAAQPSDE